jgi:hypothetical protein
MPPLDPINTDYIRTARGSGSEAQPDEPVSREQGFSEYQELAHERRTRHFIRGKNSD